MSRSSSMALLSKKERARFPDDVEFKAAFEERPVYLMNSKNKIYILSASRTSALRRIRMYNRHCDDGTYSIEHIMPQHLTHECGRRSWAMTMSRYMSCGCIAWQILR